MSNAYDGSGTGYTQSTRKSRLIGSDDISVSFEFFPPKTPKLEKALWDAVARLSPLGPDFVSVTYGAGGTTRERTHATLQNMLRSTSLKPAGHLTCVGASRQEVNEVAETYWNLGVKHIVALRGDPAEGVGEAYTPHPEGYENAADLVVGLKAIADFDISVAGYPETHPESADVTADLDNLKAKVDAGASRIITQFFFDNAHYLRFVERARAHGIWCPILPGIAPIHNFNQVAKFAAKCGTSMPTWIARRFEGLDDDPATTHLVAAALAAEQVTDLVDHGVNRFHLYTLNRADLAYAVCHVLGLRPRHTAATQRAIA